MGLARFLAHVQSYCPRLFSSKEERISFVKHPSFGDDNEMQQFKNGIIEVDESKIARSKDDTPGNTISAWQAGWNVTNAIQGMFIVSFPYAVVQGGYWAIVAMVAVSYICCYTGKILVECLYEVDENGFKVRVRNSYVEIAELVFGKRFGGKIINCAQIIELLMTCILYVLLCGDLMTGSFPEQPVDLASWIILSTFLLIPCAFLQSLRSVSWLSFWCTVAHMAINAIILVYCLTRTAEWQWKAVQYRIDIWTFPISLGIVVFSYTSQIFLPTLEGNLENKNQFYTMMNWTHVAAAAFKAVFSYICFLTFGFGTMEVITNNLPTQAFKIIVNTILVVKALFSYPLPYYAAVELIETALFNGRDKTVFPSCTNEDFTLKIWGVILRIGLVLFTMVLAICIPYFAILMGLIGSFTGTMLSFVWPCYFHLRIKWISLTPLQKTKDIIIIILGLIFGSTGIYYSAHALVRASQGLPTGTLQSHIPVAPKLPKPD